MAKKLKPVHPGEILREEFMTPLGLSMNKMAMALRVPVTRIADVVNERRGITADTALRFACPSRVLFFMTISCVQCASEGVLGLRSGMRACSRSSRR